MTTINAYLPAVDDKSVQVPIPDAANQRESWLRQMELAQLNSMSAAGGAIEHQARPHARAPAAPMQLMPQARDSEAGERPTDTEARSDDKAGMRKRTTEAEAEPGMTAETAPQAPHREHQIRAEHAGTAAAVAGPVMAMQAPAPVQPAVATPVQHTAVQAPAGGQSAAAPAGSLPAVAPGTAPGLLAAVPAGAVAPQHGQHAARSTVGAADGAPAAALQAQATAATPAAPASAQAALHGAAPAAAGDAALPAARIAAQRELLRPVVGASPELPAEEIDLRENAEPQAEQAAAEQPEEMPAWQKRMMHINGKGDDVNLFIRDSELGQAESMSLIYRIAGDMASMGLRLRGAMVNGKPALRGVLPHGTATSFEQDMEMQTTPVTQPGGNHGTR